MLLKNILMPIGCFGVPIAAGLIVLSASGVVDLQILPTSSNEDGHGFSKHSLERKKEVAELKPLPDDDELVDDAFIEKVTGQKPMPKKEEPKAEDGVVQMNIEKDKEAKPEEAKPIMRGTKRQYRELIQKSQSDWTHNYFNQIMGLFAKHGIKSTNFNIDTVELLREYWLNKTEKQERINALLVKYSVDIAQFSEIEKKKLINNLNSIVF